VIVSNKTITLQHWS